MMNENTTLSLGEQRVGKNFNPSGSAVVDEVKNLAAKLIDLCSSMPIVGDEDGKEFNRCVHLAMTNIEQGAMWAVKAATKKGNIASSTVSGGQIGATTPTQSSTDAQSNDSANEANSPEDAGSEDKA